MNDHHRRHHHHHQRPENSEETTPHWSGEHGDEWIEVHQDTIHISAKNMYIAWGNDYRFWHWIKISKDESPFELAVELVQVSWMEVHGSIDLAKFALSPSTTYEIIYKIKFSVDAFGWDSSPVTFQSITPDETPTKKSEILESHVKKRDEWHEVHGGEFILTSDMKGKVDFGMSEVSSGLWKGGLIFEGVIIRPKLV